MRTGKNCEKLINLNANICIVSGIIVGWLVDTFAKANKTGSDNNCYMSKIAKYEHKNLHRFIFRSNFRWLFFFTKTNEKVSFVKNILGVIADSARLRKIHNIMLII